MKKSYAEVVAETNNANLSRRKTVIKMEYRSGENFAEVEVTKVGRPGFIEFELWVGGINPGTENFKSAQEAVSYAMELIENYEE